MKKYQFGLSQPYFLHRSKDDSYFLFFLAILFFIGGLLSIEGSLFYIILSVSLSFIGINKLKRKDKIMQNRQARNNYINRRHHSLETSKAMFLPIYVIK